MKLVITLFFFSVVICSCKNKGAHATLLRVAPRDTSITPAISVTKLLLDSVRMESFLKSSVDDSTIANRIRSFYNSRNYQYAWFNEDGLTEPAESFWKLHERRLDLYRDSSIYDKQLHSEMNYLLNADTVYQISDHLALVELMLTLHFFKYAQSAFNGKVSPEEMQWHIPARKIDEHALLDSFLSKEQSQWKPFSVSFYRLRKKLFQYDSIRRHGGWVVIEWKKGVLKQGSRNKAIAQLKKRLATSGDYSVDDSSDVFNSELTKAIKLKQQAYGMDPTGLVGASLIKQLNVGIEDRIQQMMINLERMKWMPSLEPERLFANIPEFKLHVFASDTEALTMKIVVGRAANHTVIFSDQLKYIVFSPYWNVPRSITRNEILPAMKRSKNYLERNNMEITGYSDGIPVIRQKPGRGNALGRVKFIFPNSYNIYFHDTPAKSLFESQSRAFSHGCIRLQKPSELAEFLLRDDPAWTKKRIDDAMSRKSELWVTLREPIPVYIAYFTSWVDETGNLNFRDDIYGHDRRMAQHLFK